MPNGMVEARGEFQRHAVQAAYCNHSPHVGRRGKRRRFQTTTAEFEPGGLTMLMVQHPSRVEGPWHVANGGRGCLKKWRKNGGGLHICQTPCGAKALNIRSIRWYPDFIDLNIHPT